MTSATATVHGSAIALIALLVSACSSGSNRSDQLARADTLASQSKHSEAVAEYQRILKADADNSQANGKLGAAYLSLGELTRASHHLLRAQTLDPSDADARLNLATVYLIGAKAELAREQALSVLERDPANIGAATLVAATASGEPEISGSIQRLEAAKSRFGRDAQPRLALGTLYWRKGDAAAAERLFQEAIANDAKSAAAHSALAAFYQSRGETAQANRERGIANELSVAGSASPVKVASAHLLLARREDAKRVLRDVVQKDPTQAAAWRVLGELAMGEGDSGEVAKAVASITRRDSADIDGLMLRGRQQLARGDWSSATRDFRRALATGGELAPIHLHLGVANLQRANSAPSKEAVDTAISAAKTEIESSLRLAGNYPEAVFQLSALKMQGGAPQAAISDLERFAKLNPASLRAKLLLGAALLSSGRTSEAGETFQAVIAAAPKNAEAHHWLGSLFARGGKITEAKQEFETALKLSPSFGEPATQLVLMDLSEGRVDPAFARVTKQLEVAPQSGMLHNLLGLVHQTRNDRNAAESAYLQAVKLDPRLVDPHVRLAELYNGTGKFEQALPHADAAVRLDPKNVRALIALGSALQESGNVSRAREVYERTLTFHPRALEAANNLAVLLSEQSGELDNALKYATLAKELAPSDPHVSDTLGWILYKRGAYDQAAKLLRTSAAQRPESPSIQYHWGMTAQRIGDTAGARQALTKAVAATSSFAGKEDARRALTQLK